VRAFLPAFDLRAPATPADALALLASEPGAWRPFAGGTDLMVQLEAGVLGEGRFVSLWKLDALRGIQADGDRIGIGALTTYTDIQRHADLRRRCPLLCRAAEETGGVATQNRGTIGGNIANASPAADTPPALLVCGAELELMSVRGTRRVPYEAFHLAYKKMDLAPDELIARVWVDARRATWQQYYRKVGTRRAQAISKVCFAAAIDWDGDIVRDVRIAIGSVAPTPIRAHGAEASLRGLKATPSAVEKAQEALAADIAPIDDLRSTASYRRRVAQGLLSECLVRD
jgi:CO/xanthine dehydrogenase FAD-binding subunit